MSNSPTSDTDDVPPLEDLVNEDSSDLLTGVEIEMPDGEEQSLAEVAVDLVVGHNEIEEYKDGGLALSQSIDEAIIRHEEQGDDEVVKILKELKHTAFGLYLRVRRGDDELMGERDGNYSGYFDSADGDTRVL